MQINAIKTHRIEPGESLKEILDRYVISIEERDILTITSKIISICQSRIIKKNNISKKKLIQQEADAVACVNQSPYGIYLTIKNNILIPSAGIDESNGDGVYILYPENIQETAAFIWNYLRNKYSITNFGVIITDSHTTPMRQGVTGICIGWCGFEPLYSYIGKPDIYNQPLKVTQINLLDALATSGVLVMGEGNEQTPLAIISNAPKISFLSRPPTLDEIHSITIAMKDDLYAPLLMGVKWEYKL